MKFQNKITETHYYEIEHHNYEIQYKDFERESHN